MAMNSHVKQLVAEATSLSREELAEVVDALLIELHHPDETWIQAWAAEADRRWADYTSGKEASHDADDVLAEARDRLARRRSL